VTVHLLQLDIRGFGRLRGRVQLDAGDGAIGLLLERNEAGKSTLAAALLAALYGLDGDRRRFRGTITDLDRYRPWSEGAYGLALTLRHEGREYTVDRDFTHGTVRVLCGADDVTDRFRRGHAVAVGETFTGLRLEQFTASVFVGQGDVVWNDPERLTEALQRVADTQSGRSTAAAAVEALDRALDRYDGLTLAQPGKVDTEIQRCEAVIAEASSELTALETGHAALEEPLAALERSRAAALEDDRRRQRLRLRRLRTEHAAVRRVLDDDTAVADEIASLRSALDTAAELDTRLSERRTRVQQLRREHEHRAHDLEREHEELRRADAEIEAQEAAVRNTGLAYVPSDDEIDRLHDAARRLADAGEEHETYLRRLDEDRTALAELGHDLDEVLSLAHAFEGLTDADRVLLVGRGARRGERDAARRDHDSILDRAAHTLEDVARARSRRRRLGWGVLALAFAATAVLFVAGPRLPAPPAVLLVAAASLAVGGGVIGLTAPRHRGRDATVARATIEAASDARERLDAEESEEERRWIALAARVGIDTTDLASRYATWCRVEHYARSASVHRARADEWRATRTRALDAAGGFEQLFGESALEVRVESWVDRARAARAESERLDTVRRRADARREQLRELQVRHHEHETVLREECRALGVDVDGRPLGQVLADFETLVEDGRGREEIREHRIPLLERRRLDPEGRHAHRDRLRAIEAEIETLEPAFVDDEDAERPLDATDYEEALSALDERARRSRSEDEVRRDETRSFLAEYETRAPDLRERITSHERALQRAREHRAAVELARDTLARLGQQTHRLWAASIQRTTGDFLRRMGSEVDEVRFDENLGLRIRQHDRVFTGHEAARILSAGALDAVFLAARFAVARFLGGDRDPLPLVLDDPLANADDRRLLDTLRLLIEAVAPQQQVLLMACQRSRYEWAASRLERPDSLRALELSTDGVPR